MSLAKFVENYCAWRLDRRLLAIECRLLTYMLIVTCCAFLAHIGVRTLSAVDVRLTFVRCSHMQATWNISGHSECIVHIQLWFELHLKPCLQYVSRSLSDMHWCKGLWNYTNAVNLKNLLKYILLKANASYHRRLLWSLSHDMSDVMLVSLYMTLLTGQPAAYLVLNFCGVDILPGLDVQIAKNWRNCWARSPIITYGL